MFKSSLIFLAFFVACVFIYWYSGEDLLERNKDNAFAIFLSLCVSAFAVFAERDLNSNK